MGLESKIPEVKQNQQKYSDVLRATLPPDSPSKREVDHHIEADNDQNPPYRPVFQISPADLSTTKQYVVDMIQNEKIRPRKSPMVLFYSL